MQRRLLFEGTEFEETLAAAPEPYKTLYTLAALTGARLSKLLGLTWANLRLHPLEDAEIEFANQVDRHGEIVPTKAEESARTIPIPAELARILLDHRSRSTHLEGTAFVFATLSGRAFSQRNVAHSLRVAQTAATSAEGQPTYPTLHPTDAAGSRPAVPHGAVPSMHSFRHTVASRALLAGESIDEVAFFLGHRDANVTRAVYVSELSDARRRAMRRSHMSGQFREILGSPAR